MKRTIYLFGFFIMLFILLFVLFKIKLKSDEVYLDNLNLKIKGTVTKIEFLKQGHDFGIITLDISESNIKSYDKRNDLDRYFGIIYGTQAKIVVTNISSFSIGDTYLLKNVNYTIFRDGIKIEENTYEMPFNIINPYSEIKTRLRNFK